MSRARLGIVGLLAVALLGCSDDGGAADPTDTSGGASTVESRAAEDLCGQAESTLGAADPPTDLSGVAEDAGAIAALASSDETIDADLDPPLADALSAVGSAAAALSDAAHAGDDAVIADHAGTLSTAYDELDRVATDLQLSVCTSESWGRQVAIAAVDLTGAGG